MSVHMEGFAPMTAADPSPGVDVRITPDEMDLISTGMTVFHESVRATAIAGIDVMTVEEMNAITEVIERSNALALKLISAYENADAKLKLSEKANAN